MGGCGTSTYSEPKSGAVKVNSEDLLNSQVYADDSLFTNVEIHISCQSLANKDFMSKSDPFAVLYGTDKKR